MPGTSLGIIYIRTCVEDSVLILFFRCSQVVSCHVPCLTHGSLHTRGINVIAVANFINPTGCVNHKRVLLLSRRRLMSSDKQLNDIDFLIGSSITMPVG